MPPEPAQVAPVPEAVPVEEEKEEEPKGRSARQENITSMTEWDVNQQGLRFLYWCSTNLAIYMYTVFG